MNKHLLRFPVIGAVLVLLVSFEVNAQTLPPDPGCSLGQVWTSQGNPRSDVNGIHNRAFPDWNATYWGTWITAASGSTVTIKGRFPTARYMSLQIYDADQNVLGSIADVDINPDFGQNNPYRQGAVQGTYTVRLVFGNPPRTSIPNTLYAGSVTTVGLGYRIYYPTYLHDLTGDTFAPVLPQIATPEGAQVSCPPRPILTPEATVNGRIDNIDFVGTVPEANLPASNPPKWGFSVTNPYTRFFPSQDNSYLWATISREYLTNPYKFDMVVVRMLAPTFPNTQEGIAPYAPAQVRYWSLCQNEPLTTGVVRCAPDGQAKNVNGYVTFVISDPSKKPNDATLNVWGATWLPWGALLPEDAVYDNDHQLHRNADGVFYYGFLLYRQTLARSSFTKSIQEISKLPLSRRAAAMGPYFPSIGYCTAASFQASGSGCIGAPQ
jgi:hypothetical protein